MSVLVLGTASHVGKSTVVAALCRVLTSRGFSVAPFKSQNMSLNSYVTRDGAEIGIAQAVQAFAARLEPTADMNPILLKPKGEKVSQVVLMGKPYKDLPIDEYYCETGYLLSRAVEAAQRLIREYGNIVVEGAGGAAEVNLYQRDIANILIERELKLPIVLVADIERGGVFAQVCGTLDLLPDDIRPFVRGIIINKFRGDPDLFASGIEIIEDLTGIPVLGVLPMLSLPLPSEDSLSLGDKQAGEYPVEIAIIRLPRISNFTDFERLEQAAAVRYVLPGAPLDGYDCIILPGTKNTVEDLLVLHQSGSAQEILKARERAMSADQDLVVRFLGATAASTAGSSGRSGPSRTRPCPGTCPSSGPDGTSSTPTRRPSCPSRGTSSTRPGAWPARPWPPWRRSGTRAGKAADSAATT